MSDNESISKNFFFILASIFMVLFVSFWICVLPFLFMKYKTIKPTSFVSTLKEGMNLNRCTNIMYYMHFIFQRFLLAILIALTGIYDSLTLWSIFLGFQAIFVCLHFIKFYQNLA